MLSFRIYIYCSSGKLLQHCIAYAVMTFCPLGVKTQLRILLSIHSSYYSAYYSVHYLAYCSVYNSTYSLTCCTGAFLLHRCISAANNVLRAAYMCSTMNGELYLTTQLQTITVWFRHPNVSKVLHTSAAAVLLLIFLR